MLFTTSFLGELFPENQGVVEDNIPINEVTSDSRKLSKKSLFIPLIGESFDGHDFLKDAFNNGAVATLWQKDKAIPNFLPTDFPVFYVEDTLVALQQLAHAYRNKVNPIVIGVTGSNGKTTTKDLIGTVLQSPYKTHRTKGNFNNHIGLPLTILSMEKDTDVLVLEMGMNHFGEIELLSKIANPDFAVITNIGESHIEYLGSREGIAQAKLEIVAGLKQNGLLLIDGDEPLLREIRGKENVRAIGFEEENDVVISDVKMSTTSTLFRLKNIEYTLHLLGKHNVKNAAFAIEIADKLQVPIKKIKDAFINLELTGMRFERTKGKNGVTLINDAYNASPTSMKASIDVVKQMTGYQNKVLVLGDMYELGSSSKDLHRSVSGVITNEIDRVYTIGEDTKEIADELCAQNTSIVAKHFKSKEALVEELKHVLNEQTIILFKASRGMKLETVIEDLTSN
ncbi:UDP-N-acetylmuramoyl-tripeptide--D-alanyl-D-alanine ligase [Aquibacillus albus]|uniref:UDP-N-acetylmuramoyl-tripeptide--D-alanyl-D-alanine ligase n=1 Tax=Aquibacillus albus TaxID=1168171 RepID=A0ABS2N0Q7_9BACI|nr:UDP-N-acetylmuramoyl-tripeptide--D-alanyl-D-alanine ligase [Aquibacillus albus]MBM7571732.1 UDP-N-acetylmuramoyl-tripeptide--D-alanyl-D-alanine ligase [Aquibacillus albus]